MCVFTQLWGLVVINPKEIWVKNEIPDVDEQVLFKEWACFCMEFRE
jgi:hypothetical protein